MQGPDDSTEFQRGSESRHLSIRYILSALPLCSERLCLSKRVCTCQRTCWCDPSLSRVGVCTCVQAAEFVWRVCRLIESETTCSYDTMLRTYTCLCVVYGWSDIKCETLGAGVRNRVQRMQALSLNAQACIQGMPKPVHRECPSL